MSISPARVAITCKDDCDIRAVAVRYWNLCTADHSVAGDSIDCRLRYMPRAFRQCHSAHLLTGCKGREQTALLIFIAREEQKIRPEIDRGACGNRRKSATELLRQNAQLQLSHPGSAILFRNGCAQHPELG